MKAFGSNDNVIFGYMHCPSCGCEGEYGGFSLELYSDGFLVYRTYRFSEDETSRAFYLVPAQVVKKVNKILDTYSEEIEGFEEHIHNGSCDGSGDFFIFAGKEIITWNIKYNDEEKTRRNHPQYHENYITVIRQQNMILEIFKRISRVFRRKGILIYIGLVLITLWARIIYVHDGDEHKDIESTHDYQVLRILEEYYDHYIESITKDDKYPEELTLELDKRSSNILDSIHALIDAGADLNEGDCFNPLMMSVSYADAPMTKYLIHHGADPNYWPNQDEEPYYSNYYYDDLDIAYLNESWAMNERYLNAVLETAKVLTTDGCLGDYSGFCMSVDTKKREISFSDHALKY